MSFHPISTTIGGAKVWNEVGPGQYSESTVLFGQPRSQISVTGGKFNPKTGLVTASVQRLLERVYTVGGVGSLGLMVVSTQLSIPRAPEFSVALVDDSLGLINEFITGPTLERLLKGER